MSEGEPAAEVPGDPADRQSRGGGPAIHLMSSAADVEVALLDPEGRIVCVNDAWTRFCADNGGNAARCGVGVSYLDVCDRAADDGTAALVAASVRSALQGDLPAPLAVDVPCHSSGEMRWFDVLVSSRLDDEGACLGATVTLSLARAVSRAPSPVPTVAVDPAPAPTGWPPGERCAELLGDGVAHAVFAVAPCAVLLADDDSRIVAANAQADALFGAGAGGLVGRRLDGCSRPAGGRGSACDRRRGPAVDRPAVLGPAGGRIPHGRIAGPGADRLGARAPQLRHGRPGDGVHPGRGIGTHGDRHGGAAGRPRRRAATDFSAGLTLASVRERLEPGGAPARSLAEAIGDLDRATAELRHAGRER